jgi:aspartate/methionine/tyrosine aminotransferase
MIDQSVTSPGLGGPALDDVSSPTLTHLEWAGLMTEHNMADGHARHESPVDLADVMERLPAVYASASSRSQFEVQADYEGMFFEAAGQPSVLERPRRILHHYSSSLSIEIVANHLRLEGMTVGLLHPTFDNIPDILRRHGVPLVPVGERVLADPERYPDWSYDALFLVSPNNPTGLDTPPALLERIALKCKALGILLIVDFSFRFFSEHLAARDFYAFLEENDVDHVGIEDAGKTWPTLDLKVGTLVCGPQRHDALETVTDDLLLNVSPFIFALLTELGGSGVVGRSRSTSSVNRGVLERALEGGPLVVQQAGAYMSVAWVRMPSGWTAAEFCAWLSPRGIALLPGMPFFWADHAAGEPFVRAALMRSEQDFAAGAAALADASTEYARVRFTTTQERQA